MTELILIAVVVLIVVKTGSLGKVVKFLFRYAIYPTLFGIIFGIIGGAIYDDTGSALGAALGLIIGIVMLVRKTKNDING